MNININSGILTKVGGKVFCRCGPSHSLMCVSEFKLTYMYVRRKPHNHVDLGTLPLTLEVQTANLVVVTHCLAMFEAGCVSKVLVAAFSGSWESS